MSAAVAAAATLPAEVHVREYADVLIVTLRGEFGVEAVSLLQERLTPVAAMKPQRLIFDLSALTYIASLGLGVLVQLRRAVHRAGGAVVLAGPRPLVRELLADLSLSDLFTLHDSVEEAMR